MDWWGLTWGQVWARCSSSSAASGANDRPLFTHRPPPILLFPSTHLVFPWSLVYAKNYISRFSAVRLLESPCPLAAYLLVRSLTGDFGVGRTWFILNPTVDSVLLFSDPAPKINHTLTSKPPIFVAISSEILASALGTGQGTVFGLKFEPTEYWHGWWANDTWRIDLGQDFSFLVVLVVVVVSNPLFSLYIVRIKVDWSRCFHIKEIWSVYICFKPIILLDAVQHVRFTIKWASSKLYW